MRALRLTLAIMGWTLAGAAALAGVAISAAVLWARTPAGREMVAAQVIGLLDRQLAGRFTLGSVGVLPGGEVELKGLKVYDPEEHLVLEVGRASVGADVTRLRARVIAVTLEFDGVKVLLDEDEDGSLSLVRAFAPTEPSPPDAPSTGPSLTIRVNRLALRDGSVWWRAADGTTRLDARGLALDGRGAYGPGLAELDLAARAQVDVPVEAPFELAVRASRDRDRLWLPVLRARLGATALEAAGEGDLAKGSGRLAVTRLAVDRGQARALAPAAGDGADLGAKVFVETDGRLATAAVVVAPAGAGGSARAAVAVRPGDLASGATPAAGLDLALDRLDPSRLLAELPEGAVTLSAHGGAAGTSLDDVRGQVEARLERSKLRGVALGPGDVKAKADRGDVDVARLALAGPGVSVDGAGRWRRKGNVSGRLTVDAADLAAASRAAARLTGRPVPPASGAARLDATVSGTGQAPVLSGTLTSPALAWDGAAVRGLQARVTAAGPASAARGSVELTADALRSGAEDVARKLGLTARLEGDEASVSGTAVVPSLGAQPVALSGHGTLGARRERLAVRELSLGWPGERWALAAPATVTLGGPSVDRLELESGDQRLLVEGGIGAPGAGGKPGGTSLDARVQAVRLDLGRLPRGLLPAGLGGRVQLEGRVSGTTARPLAAAKFRVTDATAQGFDGLGAEGDLAWDGREQRARAAVQLTRKLGGRVELSADVPVPLARRRPEPVSARVTAEALPLAEALIAAGEDLPLDGRVSASLLLQGTTADPALTAEVTLADGVWDDLYPLEAKVALAAPGERAALDASLVVDGGRALTAHAELPLDLAEALARPAEAAGKLAKAPLRADVAVPAFELLLLAGAVGVPRDLTGTLDAAAHLEGTLEAPRGTIGAEVKRVAVAGYKELAARAEVRLLADQVALQAGASIAGAEILRAKGSLAGAPERLARAGALGRAKLALHAEVPTVDLSRASSPDVALGGVLAGTADLEGTLAAPALTASVSGTDLTVQGKPLGALDAGATHEAGKTELMARLRPRTGGELRAVGTVTARLGLGARDDLAQAPVAARLVAEDVDLGFLPAAAPGVVREAQGKLQGEVRAEGPLSRPSPRGRLTVKDARLAVTEYGDWSGIGVDVEVNDDAVELRKLEARRGKGTLQARGSVRGLAGRSATIEASAALDRLTVARAGMDLATFDMKLSATGSYTNGTAEVEVKLPGGTVTLPRKLPRSLQSLEQRPDIVVGPQRERKKPPRPKAAPGAPAPAGEAPLRVVVHTAVPGQLFVKGDDPRVNVELKADVTYELVGGGDYASGEVTVVRGFVEPIGGRLFELARGSVQFTGGPPTAALLDVEAHWESADKYKVTVNVSGPMLEPQVKLSSQPALEDAQIALLIATGRTELKRGSGEVGSLTATDAASKALGVVVSSAFKNMLQNKLPIDTLSFDTTSVQAGTYLPNSKIYIGYTYRFDAALDKGQNQNEVSVEYQITPRWTLESRYGDGQSGSASLIWSKDY
ncbi:MAG: translocation/assembly module TamB domain-containing protein [Anaeromyxobacter sp.]